jgi:hypothetical protein
MAIPAQGNPQIQTVRRQLPQTTERAPTGGAPFIRLVKKMQTFGFLGTYTFSQAITGFTIAPQLPAAPGFVRALVMTFDATGLTGGTVATYQADAPYSWINQVLFKDINNTTIFQLSGYELYLVNLFSGQVADSGMQNPQALPSYSAPAASGVFRFRLLAPFELNRSGYCSLAAASQATPMQVQIIFNPLAATGQVYNTITTLPTGGSVQININQLFWGMNQGDIESVHPDDLGASCQWTSAAGNQQVAANANTTVIAPTMSGWLTTLIPYLRDSTASPGPRRVGALPTTDLTLRLDGVDVYSRQLLTERQDRIAMNFALNLNGNATGSDSNAAVTASPGGGQTAGVLCYTFRDDVAETVLAADTLDELVHVAPGTRIEVNGTWGSGGTAPYTLYYISGILVPTDQYGLPYTHLTY